MSREAIIKAAGNVYLAEAAINLLDQLNPCDSKHKDDVRLMKEKLRQIRNIESLIVDNTPCV